MTSYIPFWSNDPTVLFNKKHILELFPQEGMTFDEKLNAMTRLIILLCILGFMITRSYRFLLNGAISLLIIYMMYKSQKQLIVSELTKKTGDKNKEGFSNNSASYNKDDTIDASLKIINPETLKTYLKSDFEEVKKNNPLGNVLLTDIMDKPTRKSAPPSFSTEVYEDISNNTKKMVQTLNPGIKNTNQQLFGDLGEKFEFDQSMWQYYSNPNTKIPNDQGAFADFLYGDMPSCRGGDDIACVKDNFRYNLY
uniref:Minor capsid protein P9 transmembrane helices domain-containing protein n=1 Tax=viral metagenome TaxID=1070528 RepID=A0A6C0BWE0_9ZZZZ